MQRTAHACEMLSLEAIKGAGWEAALHRPLPIDAGSTCATMRAGTSSLISRLGKARPN
jgi:hypothetical protein